MIYTTRGYVPDEMVELRETVTFEDDRMVMVRVDKFIDGEWVGNDLNGRIKTGYDLGGETGNLG